MAGIWTLTRDTLDGWIEDRCARTGAALAFYTIFSLAPILVIAIGLAGMVFGEQAARGEIFDQLRGLLGADGAATVESLLQSSSEGKAGLVATLVGFGTLLLGATTAFAELKSGLDEIWGVPPDRRSGLWYTIQTRLLSFGLVLSVGFLLLVSLIISAALAAVAKYWDTLGLAGALLEMLNAGVSFLLITSLFAAIYKLLPGKRIPWRDVWVGSAITALLFTVGKTLIGLYLGNSALASSYGAAGSFVVVLVWVYYSAQIFLLGAEFTKFYAYRFGSMRERVPAAEGERHPRLRRAVPG